MADTEDSPEQNRFGLRDVPRTTVALAALAVIGAAAIVSAPLAVWYWRKRKRADAMASHPPGPEANSADNPTWDETVRVSEVEPGPPESSGKEPG